MRWLRFATPAALVAAWLAGSVAQQQETPPAGTPPAGTPPPSTPRPAAPPAEQEQERPPAAGDDADDVFVPT
jgi:beta-lactamase class A